MPQGVHECVTDALNCRFCDAVPLWVRKLHDINPVGFLTIYLFPEHELNEYNHGHTAKTR